MKATKITMSVVGISVGALVLFSYQNCSHVDFQAGAASSQSPGGNGTLGVQSYTQSLTVAAERSNPPLDIFFIVDNSASMASHQINLAKNFATIFTNNTNNLSNFDTTVYVYSTASTLNSGMLGSIPTRSLTSLSAVPASTDIADLITAPGSIFGLLNTSQGTVNQTGYTAQFSPAPVLGADASGAHLATSLFIPHKGSMSDADYSAQVVAVTQQFQNRLAALNPNNYLSTAQQSTATASTDISSGLCTMARVLRHAKDESLVQPGDSAAFVLVSDDNDRLNDRNTGNNQCYETYADQAMVVSGSCGHHQTDFGYNTTSTITYKNSSKFSYESAPGTKISYTYQLNTEDCGIKYTTGTSYPYSYSYTQKQTTVTYQKCSQIADQTCISPTTASVTVKGSYVSSGTTCSVADMSTVSGITLPAPGTSYSCVENDLAGQKGSGTDSQSTGSACSSAVVSSLASDSTKASIVCTISGSASVSTATTSIAKQPAGSCVSICSSSQASSYPGCVYQSTTPDKSTGTLAFTQDAVTCASTCPDATQCGSGTVAAGLAAKYGTTAVCGTSSASLSNITVYGVNTTNGAALTCASPLTGLTIKNASNQTVCAGSSSVNACIQSLQDNPSGPSTCVASASVGTTTIAAAEGVTGSTTCANSNGLCTGSGTVAQYITSLGGYYSSAANGGAKSLSLSFNESIAAQSSCSTPCSMTLTGSCDGKGWGATNGALVSDYVSTLGGGASCAVSRTSYAVADGSAETIPQASVASACTSATSPVFVASGSPSVSTAASYVAGDVNHVAKDFQTYIYQQAQAVFSANNIPAVAVMGHLPNDNLPDSDVSTDYINLTGSSYFNSNQVSDINGDYAASLNNISSFIQSAAQTNFVLSLPASSTIVELSIMHSGATTWTPVDPSQWTYAGSTLSLNSGVNAQVGDQLQYTYQVPN